MSIVLNISGKIFKVSHDVISKSQLFDGMLADCVIEDEIIINRSPKLFKHVYAYLLDDKYPYPKKYYSELDYYLVPYDINLLYDPDRYLLDKMKMIEEEMINLRVNVSKSKNEVGSICEKVDSLYADHYLYKMPCEDKSLCKYLDCHNECDFFNPTCHLHDQCCCHYSQNNDTIEFCKKQPTTLGAYCDEHSKRKFITNRWHE